MKVSHYHMYVDAAGEWRWRFRSKNNKIMADSAEGYKTKSNCRRALLSFIRQSKYAVIFVGRK